MVSISNVYTRISVLLTICFINSVLFYTASKSASDRSRTRSRPDSQRSASSRSSSNSFCPSDREENGVVEKLAVQRKPPVFVSTFIGEDSDDDRPIKFSRRS